jgi:anti-sigma B factor antagonist
LLGETPANEEPYNMTTLRTDSGEETTLKVSQTLDANTVSEFSAVVDKVVQDNRKKVTVDLSTLALIDSSGVGSIVSLYKRVRASGGEVRVVGAKGQPLAIFKLLRLDRVFNL